MSKDKRVYISGPMSGLPREQYLEMFRRAEQSRGANIESCVAYHFKIWPVPKHDTAKLDKKMAKLQEKYGIKLTH